MPNKKSIHHEFEILRRLLQGRIPGVGENPEELDRALSHFLRMLEKETRTTLPPKKSFWQHHWFACANIAVSFEHFADEKRINNSMINIRTLETLRMLIEYRILERTCSYYSICRQLRFMMESMLQAYYIDTEYPDLDLMAKISVLKQMTKDRKAIGHFLLDMIDFKSRIRFEVCGRKLDVRTRIEGLYRELSDTVHPAFKDFVPFAKRDVDPLEWISRYLLVPNPRLSQYCVEKLNQVMDIIYLLVFDNYRGYAFIAFKQIRETLSTTNCHLTLSYLDFLEKEKSKKD